MKHVFKKVIAIALASAMVLSLSPAVASAAKKPSIAKKASVKVGKTVKVKVKNANKKAKVTWKSAKKAVATVKGNYKQAKVKGVAAGKAKITGTYKVGKKTYKLKCTVTVTADDAAQAGTGTAAPTGSAAPNGSAQPAGSAKPAGTATTAPKATATPKGPTPTPRPSATPSPVPKNTDGLQAYGKTSGTTITADGNATADEWENTKAVNLLKNDYSWRGTKTLTAATAAMYWAEGEFDVLVEVKKASVGADDAVILYFDEDATAKGSYDDNKNAIAIKVPANGAGAATKNGDAYTVAAAGKTTSDGYAVEIKLTGLKVAKEAGGAVRCDIQINDGKDATFNYYDSRSAMIYDKDADKWNLGDEKVAVDSKTDLMGPVNLLVAMPDPLVAIETKDGSAIITAAAIPADEDPDATYPKAKPMTFVDTSYFTSAYATAGQPAIEFANFNVPEYAGNADRVTFTEANKEDVKGYTLWDKDYLYVLFDVKDPDIAPTSADGYMTDSVELFFDEDNSGEATYGENPDAIQVRVNAIDGLFTANENGTGTYSVVAYAVQKKDDNSGYYAEFIVKFNKEHKAGDIMGVDLQINDCFTVPGEEGAEATPDRAGTVTAYDTTNNGYQDPSVFGRVKLKAAPLDL